MDLIHNIYSSISIYDTVYFTKFEVKLSKSLYDVIWLYVFTLVNLFLLTLEKLDEKLFLWIFVRHKYKRVIEDALLIKMLNIEFQLV